MNILLHDPAATSPSPDLESGGQPAASPREAALSFDRLRLRAHSEANKAALVPGVTEVERAQARAVAGLAGLYLHRIVGDAEPADARALIKDLEAICRHVDALIEAIGEEARRHSRAIDITVFRDQLSRALEGNATYELESAAERMEEEAREIEDDARGWERAHELGVD
jgi:hypothetical protein